MISQGDIESKGQWSKVENINVFVKHTKSQYTYTLPRILKIAIHLFIEDYLRSLSLGTEMMSCNSLIHFKYQQQI